MENSKVENENNYSKKMKENIRDNKAPSTETIKYGSTLQKNSFLLESEAEVSFTLTANNDEGYQ